MPREETTEMSDHDCVTLDGLEVWIWDVAGNAKRLLRAKLQEQLGAEPRRRMQHPSYLSLAFFAICGSVEFPEAHSLGLGLAQEGTSSVTRRAVEVGVRRMGKWME